jgi:O-antigen/teichoic acid export membrane protein
VFLSNPLVIGVGSFLTPLIARRAATEGRDAVRQTVRRSTVVLAVALAALVGALTLAARPVMLLMFGSQFAGHESSVVIIAVALALSAAALPARSGLLALERTDLGLCATVCGFLALMIVAPALIVRWGVLGAATALVVGNAVDSCLQQLLFWTTPPLTIRSLRDVARRRQAIVGGSESRVHVVRDASNA